VNGRARRTLHRYTVTMCLVFLKNKKQRTRFYANILVIPTANFCRQRHC
jgi:hypothetical protein